MPTRYGISSARIMLRKRTSAGSSPSSPATRSTIRSMAKAASGRPAPPYGAVGALLVGGVPGSAARGAVLFGARQMHGGVVNHAGADRIPCSAVDVETVAKREDAALVVKADVDVMHLVAGMTGAHEMLAPIFDPLHRTPEPPGQEGDQQV